MKGLLIAGTLLGYSEKPWANDSTKFNRRVGIVTGSYTDEFGQQHTNTELVDIQFDDLEKVKKQCAMLEGKEVIFPVVAVARKGGKDGAWLSKFMPKGADIVAQKTT